MRDTQFLLLRQRGLGETIGESHRWGVNGD